MFEQTARLNVSFLFTRFLRCTWISPFPFFFLHAYHPPSPTTKITSFTRCFFLYRIVQFAPVVVRSIECKRQSVQEAVAGQSATFAIRGIGKRGDALKHRSYFRKGMVMVGEQDKAVAIRQFEAAVVILHHSTTISEGYQPVVHCGVVRQSAAMIAIEGEEALRTGQRATVSADH